jgi:hypothetical protein
MSRLLILFLLTFSLLLLLIALILLLYFGCVIRDIFNAAVILIAASATVITTHFMKLQKLSLTLEKLIYYNNNNDKIIRCAHVVIHTLVIFFNLSCLSYSVLITFLNIQLLGLIRKVIFSCSSLHIRCCVVSVYSEGNFNMLCYL